MDAGTTTTTNRRRTAAGRERPAGRRERAKADKRARILAAALELFRERGYEGTSMSEVARAADVAAGTVFQYAATKSELLMMVTASLWHTLAGAGAAAEAEDASAGLAGGPAPQRAAAEAAIERLIAPFVDVVQRYPGQTTWVAREILFGDEGPHRTEVLGFVEALEQRIAQHLAGGEDARSGARLIVTGVLAELNRERQGRAEDGDLTANVHRIVALVVAGSAAAQRRG